MGRAPAASSKHTGDFLDAAGVPAHLEERLVDAVMSQPSTPLEGTSPGVAKDAIMVSGAER